MQGLGTVTTPYCDDQSPSILKGMAPRRLLAKLLRNLGGSVRKRYFLLTQGQTVKCRYFGATFRVRMMDTIGRGICKRSFEYDQLRHLLARCAVLHPNILIDVGANCGLYTCILLKQHAVRRAIAFEPDARALEDLRTNLALNDLADLAEIHPVAAGDCSGHALLTPGPDTNRGLSRTNSGSAGSAYQVERARLDDVVHLSGQPLVVKIDVEGDDLASIEGMDRTLRENFGIVQVESIDTRAAVIEALARLGYELRAEFEPSDLVFEKPLPGPAGRAN